MSFWWINCPVYYCILSIFVSFYLCKLEVYFVWYEYGYTHFLLIAIYCSVINHPFTFSLQLSFELRYVTWRQYIVGFCFLIHPATLGLLIGEFNPLTFRVIIDRWGLSTAILSYVFYISIGFFPCVSVCHFGLVVFL